MQWCWRYWESPKRSIGKAPPRALFNKIEASRVELFTVEFEKRFPSKAQTFSFPTPHSELNLARKPLVSNFSTVAAIGCESDPGLTLMGRWEKKRLRLRGESDFEFHWKKKNHRGRLFRSRWKCAPKRSLDISLFWTSRSFHRGTSAELLIRKYFYNFLRYSTNELLTPNTMWQTIDALQLLKIRCWTRRSAF